MRYPESIRTAVKFFVIFTSIILFWCEFPMIAYGQEFPPRPITVTVSVIQNLNFGTFYQGNSGGTVIIYPDGSRSATGDVVLLMGTFSTGLYSVTGNTGTLITILNGPDATLTGSNGGTLTLQIGGSDPASPFILTSPTIQVRIGGTLIVGDPLLNRPGNYSGFFDVTFFQE